MIPGWPCSVIAALEPGRTSWTAVLDAVRLGPGDDEAEVTAAQVRDVITWLVSAGHWREGDAPVLVIFDAGYDLTRLACLLAGLPVEVLGRLRSDRLMQLITCHTQLRLARPLADDLRLPWERPAPPGRLTPARVRRGFRNIRAALPCPAGAPKPGKPGPGRPPGSKNRRPAPRHDVGKTTRREHALKARRERAG
jgi:DDE superfamily endonuclease